MFVPSLNRSDAVFSFSESRAASLQLRVAVYGHSFIHWAVKHAMQSGWGCDLGLGASAALEWKSKRGMILELAVPSFRVTPPDILVVNLGGNDLMKRTGKSLILQIIQDLQVLKDTFPSMKLIWSNMIPHTVWRADCKPGRRDRAWRDVN